uniref:Small nuclear RNA activating complex, polypeptide 4 n=1 Tax=Salmo trutta TaxID=8032 RepID=A0A674B8U8_SALTR
IMSSDDLLAQRERIERQILALEQNLGSESNSGIELLSSDSCASGWYLKHVKTLLQCACIERTPLLLEEDSAEELDLPQNIDTCLQINLVYQEVLKEKLEDLERLLTDNQQQQKEIMSQLSGTGTPQATTSGEPTLKLFLGSFLNPYFRDKVTFLGPPANPETREKMSKRIRPTDDVKMKRWEGWQKTLLINAVVKDSMKRMTQPKLSKIEYLTQKMAKAENMEKLILQKQITEIEKDIEAISALKEDELMGGRYDDHDWQKISNIDFEGIREAEDIKSFWQNYLHPSINKASWKEDEIEMLKKVAVKYGHHNWDQIADKLGTNRTAFMCLQTYQRYICTDFKRRMWGRLEDDILRELVEKMRIGNYIPYTQISYFMEGRDSCQLMYRWTQVLDPTLTKGYWSKEEDEMLLRAVAKHGAGNWWKMRQDVPGRNDSQCRDRYVDVLIGNVKKGPFDEEEKAQLRQLVEKYGLKWAKIASEMPNRIDCQVLQQWRRMTGYKVSVYYVALLSFSTQSVTLDIQLITRLKRLDDDVHSSADEEESVKMEFMDSDDDKKQKFFELYGSDQESDIFEDYTQPDMEQWIPMREKQFEGMVRSVMVKRPSKDTTQEQAATDSQAAARKFMVVRSTVLDRFGKPAATVIGQNPPILAKKVPAFMCVQTFDWYCICLKKNSVSTSSDQGTPHNCSRQKDSSANSETYTTLNYSLQLAVTPWVGNVLMPPPISSNKLTLLKKPKQRHGPRTVASMLNQKGNEQQNSQQQNSQLVMMIPQTFVIGQPVVQSIPHPTVPFTPTSRQQLMPSTLTQPGPSTPSRPIPSTPGQPLPSTPSQPIPPAPVQSSTIIDRVNVQVNENLSAKKRNLKPTEKSQAPKEVKDAAIAEKSVEQSPKRKKARTQSPPKGNLVGQLSNVILSPPQTAWVLTRNGLVPISGIGIQMTPQNLPANAFAPACPSPVVINQQVPLTLNAAAAQASSDVTHVCPLPSASSIAQGTASPSVFSSPSTTFISNTAPRMTNPVNSMIMTNPALQTVATTGPQLNAVSPVLSVPMNTVISAPIRPQTGPPQAFVLNVPPGSLPASFPQGAFRIMQLYPPKRVPPPRNPEVIQFDPNLMFMENPAKVSEWLNGKNGIALPELDVTLPYLPPFVSSLNTFLSLLKCKTTLAISAMLVLRPEEKENQEEEQQVAAVRSLVAERFIHNPGYLLLKARFLSCFTMPALLATINPVKFSMSPTTDHSDVEEEPFRNRPGMQNYTVYEQPTTLQVSSVSNQSSFICLIHCLSVLFPH